MRKEILLRVRPDSEKRHHSTALKVAAGVSGVESVTVAGRDRDLLLVIGDGVDESRLKKKLNREVGQAEIVELRALPAGAEGEAAAPYVDALLSPYHHSISTPGRDRAARRGPVAAALWPGEHGDKAGAGYGYPATPSPRHHRGFYPPPVAARSPGPGHAQHGGYGYGYGHAGSSSYARDAARSHPANYSPMIARHDHRVAGRPRATRWQRWRERIVACFYSSST